MAYTTAHCKPTDTIPPKLTESNGYLFIYSLIIYSLSPSKKDLSASRDALAPPPQSISNSRQKTTSGEVVFGFIPGPTESQGNA